MRIAASVPALLLATLTFDGAACAPPRGPATTQSPRYATVAAEIGGRVYVVGGMVRVAGAADVVTPGVEAYDPDDGSWTRCAPMPTARAFSAAAVHDGKLYVFGGIGADGKALDAVEAFDPSTNSWTVCSAIPEPRSRCAAAFRPETQTVFVGGGMDDRGANLDQVRVFEPDAAGSEWRGTWPFAALRRHGFVMEAAGDGSERVFAVGGYDDAGPTAAVEWFGIGAARARQSTETTAPPVGMKGRIYDWRPAPSLAHARGFFGLARIGTRLYAVGGRCPTIPPTEVLDVADVDAGWKPRAPLPKDLCRFSMVAWKGRLLVFGGETEFGAAVNTDVLEYDPADDAWSVR